MKTDLFDFHLPPERIAHRPARPRDAARLLCVAADGPRDRTVGDLPALLDPGDLLVFNDTRVIPARLVGRRGRARVAVTLHRRVDDATWRAFARPARKLRLGETFRVGDDALTAEVTGRGDGGEVELRFDRGGAALMAALRDHGHIPLPPYIDRPDDRQDADDYQTWLARRDGAVAAPTAGLHFTPRLLEALDARGVERTTATLHVGAGTFQPVKTEDTADHAMHSEWGELPEATAGAVNACRARGNRVVPVGTTALRLLETAATDGGVVPWAGDTDLFITPGFRFRVADRLLTNFHLPRSTLFMLVCAFTGIDRMKAAYDHAVAAGYRFYSYGDACLLDRCDDVEAPE